MAKLTLTAFTPAALKKYVEHNNLDLYSSKRLDIPVLRYYVFYNGKRNMPDETFLKLTDSMHGDNAADISSAEFTACMININAGHSTGIMERCPLLYQYSLFVADLRKNIDSGMFLGDAIDSTVENCIKKDILADILRAHRAEVTNMLFKEYDSAAHIASEKDISYEEGRLAEHENTKREKERADRLQSKVSDLQSQNSNLQNQLNELEIETNILSYHAQGKTDEEIAHLCQKTIDDIQNILKKYHIQ